MEEQIVKISNPERVERVLRRICEAGLQVLVRGTAEASVAVKGRATSLILDGLRTVRIANISEKGILHLMKQELVQIEFVLMAAKVTFVSRIMARERGGITVSFPAVLTSIERRKNARFPMTQEVLGYLRLSSWDPVEDDAGAPPVLSIYNDMANVLVLQDISLGGVCVSSRYPIMNQVLKRGLVDDGASIIAPMRAPFKTPFEVRWAKTVREDVKDRDGGTRTVSTFKYGLQFVSPTEEILVPVRQFIQMLAKAEAI